MRVALVHDYLGQDGGAERVLKALHEIWPTAPIFVLTHNKKKFPQFAGSDIRETFLARLPFGRTQYEWYLPWMPLATESHELSNFDLVVSTSSIFAKGIITGPKTLHISYCHTPPRFLWADNYRYLADLKYNPLIKMFLPGLLHRLRLWDRMSIDRVDHFIANSETVRARISKYYRRESLVIYPPVDTGLFAPTPKIGDYFLAGGRLVPYKRLDLVIRVFNRLRWPLKIFGVGIEEKKLRRIARRNIEFLGKISDTTKAELFTRALAFIHPQVEDSGITPIESMAAGRPVIAYHDGGAAETVTAGETGIFFEKQNWESLFQALIKFDPAKWDGAKIRERALLFDTAKFKEKIQQTAVHRYEEFQRGLDQKQFIGL